MREMPVLAICENCGRELVWLNPERWLKAARMRDRFPDRRVKPYSGECGGNFKLTEAGQRWLDNLKANASPEASPHAAPATSDPAARPVVWPSASPA